MQLCHRAGPRCPLVPPWCPLALSSSALSPSLQEQLRRLYPRLKVLAFGARPEAALHTYFPSFLSRATLACPPAMKKEVSLAGFGGPMERWQDRGHAACSQGRGIIES